MVRCSGLLSGTGSNVRDHWLRRLGAFGWPSATSDSYWHSCRADEDGVWPHRILRDLIEDGVTQEIEEGLQIGLLIGRGVVTKALDEGGRQERELAAKYAGYAAHVEHRWPHTATVLRDISNDYERQARRDTA